MPSLEVSGEHEPDTTNPLAECVKRGGLFEFEGLTNGEVAFEIEVVVE